MTADTGNAETYAFESPALAVGAMLRSCQPVGSEHADLSECHGRVLADDVRADRDSPACDVSAMDGYAVSMLDAGANSLPVAGEVRIGEEPGRLLPGSALRIVTGAPVPQGADLVVRREDVVEEEGRIRFMKGLVWRAGTSVRRRGENIGQGEVVVGAGRVIDSATIGALATFGIGRVPVFRRVRVGLLVTGDELVDVAGRPSAWQVRDSNGEVITSLVQGLGWARVVGGRALRAGDRPDELHGALGSLLKDADAIVVTGGVSMGVRDFVPSVLQGLGAQVLFHRLPQRPGKPVLGGVIGGRIPVFALPGNPVSVMVTARRMLAPCLAKLAGIHKVGEPGMVSLTRTFAGIPLWWHRPVRLLEGGVAEVVEGRGSGDIVCAARSDGFVEIPPGQEGLGPWPFYPWAAWSAAS